VSHVARHDRQAVPQRNTSNEHVRHTDDAADSLQVGANSAGEARSGVIKWQDLRLPCCAKYLRALAVTTALLPLRISERISVSSSTLLIDGA